MKIRSVNRLLIFAFLALAGLTSLSAPRPAAAQGEAAPIVVMNIDGEIAQPMLEYLRRGVQSAEQNGAQMVLLNLDTPGGQIVLMGNLVEVLRASPVPVVVYVNPRGRHGSQRGHADYPGGGCGRHGAANHDWVGQPGGFTG